MLFDKFNIGMTPITSFYNVGSMGHRFWILAWEDIMFSVAIITISCPLHSLHDELGVKSLLILFLCFLMTNLAVHPLIRSLLPPFGVSIVLNPGVAV